MTRCDDAPESDSSSVQLNAILSAGGATFSRANCEIYLFLIPRFMSAGCVGLWASEESLHNHPPLGFDFDLKNISESDVPEKHSPGSDRPREIVVTSCAMKTWRDITVVNNRRTHNNSTTSKYTHSLLAKCYFVFNNKCPVHIAYISIPNFWALSPLTVHLVLQNAW